MLSCAYIADIVGRSLLDMRNTPFTYVEDKLSESEFFLEKMESAGSNMFAVRCYFSAFVSASRSVTFSLQAVMKHVKGFKEWYSNKQEELRQNPLAVFFVERRNEAVHIADTRINSGKMYQDENGRLVVRYYFSKKGPTDSFEPIESDVITASRGYLKVLQNILYECCRRFASELDPDMFYAIENLKAKNISIEDLEEALGFPRGWTDGIPDEERLRLLKESTSPLDIGWLLTSIYNMEQLNRKTGDKQ